MTINHSTNRWICRLLSLLWLSLAIIGTASAGEVPMRSYAARYDVSVGERRIGVAELRLERQDTFWRFYSVSKAQGIYALMTRRQPSTNTRFRPAADGLWLRDVRIGDAAEQEAREAASFNWEKGRLSVLRKGQKRRLRLDRDADVHDFLTVHWLAADLMLSDRQQASFKLYRKGRLVASTLSYRGEQLIDLGQRQIVARVYEQAIDGKSTRLRYFYDADNPLLPLKIEKNDDNITVMTLNSVEFDL